MPANPGANLGWRKLKTKRKDIGHVAPSFEKEHVIRNTLLIRPERRISLRLGDIDELFPNPPDTSLGRMERLQVLGLFYYPLGHSKARTSFDGIAAMHGPAPPHAPPPAPAVMGAWEYFKKKVLNNVEKDEDADQEINRMLGRRIVDGGELPPPVEEGEDPVEKNFKKIRIPGGYSLLKSWQATALDLNDDTRAKYAGWTLGKDMYEVETQFREDNPVIGKIPLIAKVEKLDTSTNEWKPEKSAWVYFQLVDPYDLPAFDPARPVTGQLNRPPLRQTTVGPPAGAPPAMGPPAPAQIFGPDRLTISEEHPSGARAPDGSDPQRGNCPEDRGGEQGKNNLNDGTDVENVIFLTKSVCGFNKPYQKKGGRRTRPAVRTRFFPTAKRVKKAAHGLHAVKAKTNQDGEAGVIFTPSRCGGDRYRIRAYVGSDTMKGPGSDGTGAQAVRVEMGTFVVWRNMRISRYVRQPVNAPAAVLLAEVNNATYNITTNNRYLQRTNGRWNSNAAYAGLPTADFSDTVNAGAVYDSIPLQWARAFLEVEIDRAAQGNLPENLSAADWQAAREQAWRDAQSGMATIGVNLNLERLLHLEAGSTVTVNNAVIHLPMRTPEAYNAGLAVGDPQRINLAAVNGNNQGNIGRLFSEYMIPGFFRSLSNNGYTPGLTIVQGGYGCTWTLIGLISDSSGTSLEYRGGLVWGGRDWYPTAINVPAPPGPPANPPWGHYDFTSNSAHELGHVVYRLHAPGNDPNRGAGGGNDPDAHDDITNNESICVMSYKTCEGQFCAKCLFAFRGWDMSKIP